MCLILSIRLTKAKISDYLTAIPIFRTFDKRAASRGSRLSIMVSWARFSGSAACSRLALSDGNEILSPEILTPQRQRSHSIFAPAIACPVAIVVIEMDEG